MTDPPVYKTNQLNELRLAKLVDEVNACRLCEAHLPLGCKPIFQVSSSAKILVVGQAPGKRAHQQGKPFDDLSGDRLRTWLGIDRSTFYDATQIACVPMGFCYPGTGNMGDYPPRPECAETWRNSILQCLRGVELTLLIGSYAQNWHIGAGKYPSLTATVKDWQVYWPHALPMPHPSPRNIRWLKTNPWFETEIIPLLQIRVRKLLKSRT